MKISLRKFNYMILCIVIGVVSYFVLSQVEYTYDGVARAGLIQFSVFLIEFAMLGICSRKIFSFYSIFLLVFYLFQNGQILLYSLGVDYDYFYIERYGAKVLIQSIAFSTACLSAAFAAGVFSMPRLNDNQSRFFSYMDSIDINFVQSVAKSCMVAFGIIAIPYMVIKFYLCSIAGYFSVISFTAAVPSVLTVIEKMFISFSLLTLIFTDKGEVWNRISTIVILIWSLFAALSGDRTVGIAGLAVVAIYRFNLPDSTNKEKKNKSSFSKYIGLLIAGVFIIYLISYAFSYRMQSSYENVSVMESIVDAVGTLGFSFFPLVLIMKVCPSQESFLYGKSLIGGLVSGFIPDSLDFLGISQIFSDWSAEPSLWIEEYYNYNFGIDFSLNAECYANFGNLGWIIMFVLCSIVALALRESKEPYKLKSFSYYGKMILLYSWFTLPRRKSYYIYNNFFWYILVVAGIIVLISKITSSDVRGGVIQNNLIRLETNYNFGFESLYAFIAFENIKNLSRRFNTSQQSIELRRCSA